MENLSMKLSEAAIIFDALSQENRLKIFRLLVQNSKTGMTPTEISKKLGNMPRNTLSFHLSLLTQAGLCSSVKKGKTVIYKPKCSIIKEIAAFLLEDCCDGGCKC